MQFGDRTFLVRSSTMNTDFDRQQLARAQKQSSPWRSATDRLRISMPGRPCPTCTGQAGYSRITDAEMKVIMKNAVDHVYALLSLKTKEPGKYESQIRMGEPYTAAWDEASISEGRNA
jgi:hypothetical protein